MLSLNWLLLNDGFIKSILAKMETILENHMQSGHHSSGEEHWKDIMINILNTKGKNIDLSTSIFFNFGRQRS